MKLKNLTTYISTPSAVVTILFVMLIIVCFAQLIPIGVANLFFNSTRDIVAEPVEPMSPSNKVVWERIKGAKKEFLPDGTMLLIKGQTNRSRNNSYTGKVKVLDFDGKMLFKGHLKDAPLNYITWAKMGRYYPGRFFVSHFIGESDGEFTRWLRVPVTKSVGGRYLARYWRYQPREEIFVGYNPAGNRIGYIGANGMQQTSEKAEPFGNFEFVSGWWPKYSFSPVLLWVTKDRLYQINFATDTVKTLFETGGQEITELKTGGRWYDRSGYDQTGIICLTTADGTRQIISYDKGKKNITKLPPESSVSGSIGTVDGKLFLRKNGAEGGSQPRDLSQNKQWLRKYRSKPYKRWIELYEITPEGKTHLLSRNEWTAQAISRSWLTFERSSDKVHNAVMIASPPVYSLAWRGYYREGRRQWNHMSETQQGIVHMLKALSPREMWSNLILSLVLAGFAGWHGWARRTSWKRFVFWVLFVVAFNLAGLLTYLALNHTAVIRCPICSRKRSLQRETCRACNAPLPAPKRREVDLVLCSST